MPLKIAIIGSGPAGFYTAEALAKNDPDCQIDFIEKLPTPYGLIRAGVAPDHQTTKKITKKYEQTALRDQVSYYGNVEVGRDLSLDEVRAMYDAVVLAVGAPGDTKLDIPGADKKGIYGSAEFVAWYNGHPDYVDLNPALDTETAVVIGVGNVAMDVARVLLRSPQGMATSDLADHAAKHIHAAPIKEVHMVGRRGPADAKFTNVELRELGHLNLTQPRVNLDQLPGEDDLETVLAPYDTRDQRLRKRNIDTLREFGEREDEGKPKSIHFEFFASPIEILGDDRVEAVKFERTVVENGRTRPTGETFEIACGLLIPSIGYRGAPVEGAPFNDSWGIIPNEDGRVEQALYAVGWIKRGPSGVISSNRPDGEAVADHIREDITADASHTGRDGLESLLRERSVRWVSFAEWQKLDAMEVEAASDEAPRKKFVTVKAMLNALDGLPN